MSRSLAGSFLAPLPLAFIPALKVTILHWDIQNWHPFSLPSTLTAPVTIQIAWVIPFKIKTIPAGRSYKSGVLKICKGDSVNFGWNGVHGVATTTAAKYKTCNLSGYKETAPVSGGGGWTTKPSGTNYYICQVAGHCTQGKNMKEKESGFCTGYIWDASRLGFFRIRKWQYKVLVVFSYFLHFPIILQARKSR